MIRFGRQDRQDREDRALQKSLKGVTSVKGVKNVSLGANPLLTSRTPVWRSRLLVGGLALGFAIMAGRAAYVQIFGNDFFLRQGEVRFARTLEMPANRGRILDRNGLILASSVPAESIWAFPEEVDQEEDAAKLQKMAKLLGMPLKDIQKRLDIDNKNFVYIKRQVDESIAKQIAELHIKGIYQRKEYRRQYPEGEAVAHIVGFTDVEDKGQEGMERTFNAQLAGKPGSRRVIKDRLGRVIEGVGEQVPPMDGQDIHLTIDSKVQYFAWQKLRDAVQAYKAKGGSVVVLDVQTGEVLALANYPSYDPGVRGRRTGEQLRNRALTDIFEPGSTMKPFVVAWALETGKVKPETPINTSPGSVLVSGIAIRDAHPHGMLSVREVIQKSSNIGTVRIAMQMQPRELWELFSNVGYGQKPQINFPGAVTGRLRPFKTWRPIEQATMSYGYGLSASLLQMARAYTVFARDGEVIPVSLLKQDHSAAGLRVISPETAREIRTMLQMAAAPGGTGQLAQTIGYSVGGKSGTAHKQEGKGYASNKYRSWFVGLAPIGNPRIVVAVMIDEPSNGKYYGGAVAAPVFSQVVQQTLRTLGVPPDLDVKTNVVAQKLPDVPESF